jgi:hypothetical protein
LKEKGVNVFYVNNAWRDERDILIGKCKILVNIHYGDDYNVYESIRCDRWIFSGKVVVSESSQDQENLDIYPLVEWAPYDKLVDKVIETLKNYDEIVKKRDEKLIDKIAENRKQFKENCFKQIGMI